MMAVQNARGGIPAHQGPYASTRLFRARVWRYLGGSVCHREESGLGWVVDISALSSA